MQYTERSAPVVSNNLTPKQLNLYEILAIVKTSYQHKRTYGVFHMTTKKQIITYEIITV